VRRKRTKVEGTEPMFLPLGKEFVLRRHDPSKPANTTAGERWVEIAAILSRGRHRLTPVAHPKKDAVQLLTNPLHMPLYKELLLTMEKCLCLE